jgi:hypothetical protein
MSSAKGDAGRPVLEVWDWKTPQPASVADTHRDKKEPAGCGLSFHLEGMTGLAP